MKKRLQLWQRWWRTWNYRHSINAYNSLFMGIDEDVEIAYERHPYVWWFLICVPIAGIVIFGAPVQEYRFERRRKALEERKRR